jgi:hypothetical protein
MDHQGTLPIAANIVVLNLLVEKLGSQNSVRIANSTETVKPNDRQNGLLAYALPEEFTLLL